MENIEIVEAQGTGKRDRRGLAELYMGLILDWFADPEHEQEYQDWKKQREKLRKESA